MADLNPLTEYCLEVNKTKFCLTDSFLDFWPYEGEKARYFPHEW